MAEVVDFIVYVGWPFVVIGLALAFFHIGWPWQR